DCKIWGAAVVSKDMRRRNLSAVPVDDLPCSPQAGGEFATYEVRLDANRRWALSEGSRHFEENSSVFKALRRITARLEDLGISYAVVGGMALFRHGLRRFTEDVDI